MNDEEVLTAKEVAQLLQVIPRTVRNYANAGLIPSFRVGINKSQFALRFMKKDVMQVIESRRVNVVKTLKAWSISEVDLGWLAGIIDGEGSFSVYKRKTRYYPKGRGHRWTVRLEIPNTSLALLEKCKTILSMENHKLIKQKRYRINHNQAWKLQICPNKLVEILPFVIPHLTVKRQRAEIALKVSILTRENVRDCFKTPKENDPKITEYALALKKLNKRGRTDERIKRSNSKNCSF